MIKFVSITQMHSRYIHICKLILYVMWSCSIYFNLRWYLLDLLNHVTGSFTMTVTFELLPFFRSAINICVFLKINPSTEFKGVSCKSLL
jgi:hypothetical protein